jgi:hypothetical protein
MDKCIEPKNITPWTCTHKKTSTSNSHQEYKFMCVISLLASYLWSPECWHQDTHLYCTGTTAAVHPLQISSHCSHSPRPVNTQYVHCHDLRNRTTEYHLNMHTHAHARMLAFMCTCTCASTHTHTCTCGSFSRTCTFAKPSTYTLNPNSKTSTLAFKWNIWG